MQAISSQNSPTSPLLRVDGISVRFGGIVALDNVSFDVGSGQICGLIGPNGAGKSTLFNCISRLYKPIAGHIDFDGRRLTDLGSHQIAGAGIGRTFQNVALFGTMTVSENIMVGCHDRLDAGFIRNALRLRTASDREAQMEARAAELLDLLDLGDVAHRVVDDLPFGTRKRVELARALAVRPKLLLLDEPACGLNHEEIARLAALIADLRKRLGVTILLVEHNMNLVMAICERIVALNFGRVIAAGTPGEIRSHPEVIRAYLGDADDAGSVLEGAVQ